MVWRMPFLRRVGREVGALVCAMLVVCPLAGAEALFPKPLHLVRRIEDPIAQTTITVHEYCAGNRIATIHGERVAIVDYDLQRIIEIDRAAGTYSVTRFEEAAKTQTRALKVGEIDGKLEIDVDRRVELSRDAVEALIGAAYPNERRAEHDALLEASRGPRDRVATESAAKAYALPTSQVTTFDVEGRTLVVKNTIVAVTSELAPAELLAIPAGARQVESRITRAARELRALDSSPP